MKSLEHLGPAESRAMQFNQGARPNEKKGIKSRPCLKCDVPFNTTIYHRICKDCTKINDLNYGPLASGDNYHYSGARRVGKDACE